MKLDLLNLSQRQDFAYGAKQNKTEHRTTVQKVPKAGVKDKYSINTKCQFKMKGGNLVISIEKFTPQLTLLEISEHMGIKRKIGMKED